MAGEDLVISKAYFEDPCNCLSFEKVQNEAFTLFKDKVFSGGFKRSTYWLRLAIAPSNQEVVLRIRPSYTDEVELFDPADNILGKKTGEEYPWNDSDVKSLGLNFKIPESTKQRDIYLRVKSEHSYLLSVEAYQAQTFFDLDSAESFVFEGYVIFLGLLFMWLLVSWLAHKEKVLGYFVTHQWIAFIHGFMLLGFGRMLLSRYISPIVLNELTYWLILIYINWAIVCHKNLLMEYGLKTPCRYITNFLLSAGLIAIVFKLFGDTHIALVIGAGIILSFSVCFLLFSWFGLSASNKEAHLYPLPIKVLRAYYTFIFIIWFFTQITLIKFINFGSFAIYSIYAYSFINSLLLFGLLKYRERMTLKQEWQRANQSEMKAEQEQIRRKEQGKLMAMLTHEIKTPLQVLKLVVDEGLSDKDLTDSANQAVRNIDSIINRCLALDRVDADLIQIHPSEFVIGELIDRVAMDLSVTTLLKQGDINSLITTDRDLLYVIIKNLLENAVKYSAKDSSIIVEVHQMQGQWSIAVINLIGTLGAPDEKQVFEKYYRNQQATRISGSGLGLFLVKSLVGLLGGKVQYSTNTSTVQFTVWLPR
jgi:signal transduction histidine kinase